MLIFTGSWDGHVRVWQLEASLRSFSQLLTLPIDGFINALQILSLPAGTTPLGAVAGAGAETDDKSQIILTAAVSQEPRLGRWLTQKDVKNGILVAVLPTN